jgi:hypothetical protein
MKWLARDTNEKRDDFAALFYAEARCGGGIQLYVLRDATFDMPELKCSHARPMERGISIRGVRSEVLAKHENGFPMGRCIGYFDRKINVRGQRHVAGNLFP